MARMRVTLVSGTISCIRDRRRERGSRPEAGGRREERHFEIFIESAGPPE